MINKFQFSKEYSETSLSCQEPVYKLPKERINTLWSKQENFIYIEFLKQHRQIFTTQEVRRHHKVFIQLAKLLPTRSSDQCRSHHQKMMISHKSIDKIIKHLNKKMTKLDKKSTKSGAQNQTQIPLLRQLGDQKNYENKHEIFTSQTKSQISIWDHESSLEDKLWDVLA